MTTESLDSDLKVVHLPYPLWVIAKKADGTLHCTRDGDDLYLGVFSSEAVAQREIQQIEVLRQIHQELECHPIESAEVFREWLLYVERQGCAGIGIVTETTETGFTMLVPMALAIANVFPADEPVIVDG